MKDYMQNNKRKKMDLSITPLRLAVTVVGLLLIGLNEYFLWNIPAIGYVVPIAIMLSVFLTQPKNTA